MWTSDQITIELEDVDGSTILVAIETPAGLVSLMGTVSIVGRVLHMDGAHIDGLRPGELGRAGLNAIARKFLEVADVDEIVIQGSTRSTGRLKGKTPRCIRFPKR